MCADSTPACFRARLTSEEIVDEFPNPINGARWRRNTRAWTNVAGRDVNSRQGPFPTSAGQGQLSRFPALSANGDLARAPIDIVQIQPDHFAGAHAEPGEQQQDRVVPPADGVFRSQHSSIRSTREPEETSEAWKATSWGPWGRKQQDR